jgi:DNA repair photolyase
MKRYSSHKEKWGDFVDVKINAPTIVRKQAARIKRGRVLFSSVTDAYQPVEKTYEITRKCLQQLVNTEFFVSILTKSSLVTRDIDILQRMMCEVGFTITTLDDTVRSVFEPKSSPVQQRLQALKNVHEAGIATYAFFGPVIPGVSDSEESVNQMFDALHDHVGYVIVDKMNMYSSAWKRIQSVLHQWNPGLIPEFNAAKSSEYESVLRERVKRAATVPVEFCF